MEDRPLYEPPKVVEISEPFQIQCGSTCSCGPSFWNRDLDAAEALTKANSDAEKA